MSVAPQDMRIINSSQEDEILWQSYWSSDQSAATDASRSSAILRAWQSYLPENCVAIMIKNGLG
jgi:hypothetical protein